MDVSVAKAIIKRAMTEQDIFLENHPTDSIMQKLFFRNGRQLSTSAIYRNFNKFFDIELKGQLLKKYKRKHKLFRFEELVYVYVDIAYNAALRRNYDNRYPKEFWVSARYLDKKGKWADISNDYNLFKISVHCMERLIQRSNAKNLEEAIKLLCPITDYVLKICEILLEDHKAYVITAKEFLIYWAGGYLVLRREIDSMPILITWIPKLYFSQNQHAKFINFQERVSKFPNKPIIFDSEIVKTKNIINTEDELKLIDINWSINQDASMWDHIRNGD